MYCKCLPIVSDNVLLNVKEIMEIITVTKTFLSYIIKMKIDNCLVIQNATVVPLAADVTQT